MHFLAVLAVLVRLLVIWPLLLMWWAVGFVWALIFAFAKAVFYLARLLVSTVLRPLGHRFVLIAVAIGIVIIAARDPRLQNPSFYGVLAVSLLVCFFAGKFGWLLFPKAAPDFTGMVPSLPGWPNWPPIPKPRPRVKKVIFLPEPRAAPRAMSMPAMPIRPAASAVYVMAMQGPPPASSEEEAVAALPEALQRLMRPKDISITGAPVPPQTSEGASPE